jgi:hypothetical protein
MSRSIYHMTKQRAATLFNSYTKEEEWHKALMIMIVDLQAQFFTIQQREKLFKAYQSGIIAEKGKDLDALFSLINLPQQHNATLKTKNTKLKELMVKTRKLAKDVFKKECCSFPDGILQDENMSITNGDAFNHIRSITSINTSLESCPSWSNQYPLSSIPTPDYLLLPMIEEFNFVNDKYIEEFNNYDHNTANVRSISGFISTVSSINSKVLKHFPIDIEKTWEAIKKFIMNAEPHLQLYYLKCIDDRFKCELVDSDSYFDYIFNILSEESNHNSNIYFIEAAFSSITSYICGFNSLLNEKTISTIIDKINARITSDWEKQLFHNFYRNSYGKIIQNISSGSSKNYGALRVLHKLLTTEDFEYLQHDIKRAINYSRYDNFNILKELHPSYYISSN